MHPLYSTKKEELLQQNEEKLVIFSLSYVSTVLWREKKSGLKFKAVASLAS
jgi:hypothetical protein